MDKIVSGRLIHNKKAVPKEFNKIAKRYDLATGLSHGYQNDLDFSASLLNLKGGERVLDLCCGTGKSTKAILKHQEDIDLIGIDNSEVMLAEARSKLKDQATFQLQDAMELDFPPASFDAIFMAYGLRNMPDAERCLENLLVLLKPGGKLVIHDYSLSNNWYASVYWCILGYGFIVPFCTLLTGSSKIFRYLIKSVLRFQTKNELRKLLFDKGFKTVGLYKHKNWRRPILVTFLAIK